jgi:hypothetical protein
MQSAADEAPSVDHVEAALRRAMELGGVWR